MKLFSLQSNAETLNDFSYLDKEAIYFDSACQTLRPQMVIDAMTEYFHAYNACGGRVKYEWGMKVDEKIAETKEQILDYVGKSGSEYVVAFTLNTTYGINLVLSQLPRKFERVVTSDIEHNSVFLPTIATAKRLDVPRVVLSRSSDGSLPFHPSDLAHAIVVLNNVSNIDGRVLLNLKGITNEAHKTDGIVLVDAAQGLSLNKEILRSTSFDALFFAGHKLYSSSLGIIVIKRSLLSLLDIQFIGGGTVEDVQKDTYSLVSSPEDISGRLEAGLQDFAGIVGLNSAIKWLKKYKPEGRTPQKHLDKLAHLLFDQLPKIPTIKLINSQPTPIITFYSEKIDAHTLAIYLSAQNIMARSGYFCCHYYLKQVKKYPPLLRISLGLHNTEKQIEIFVRTLTSIIHNI